MTLSDIERKRPRPPTGFPAPEIENIGHTAKSRIHRFRSGYAGWYTEVMPGAGATSEFPAGGFQFRRLIFWDFPRASWPYDVVVALILLFIFATPRDWFRDQPRAVSVVLISSNRNESRYFIAGDMLTGVNESTRASRAEMLIHERTGKRMHVKRLEPITDEQEQETHGFVAYTTP